MKFKLSTVLVVLMLATFACGQLDIGVENPGQNQPVVDANVDQTSTDEPKPSPTPIKDSLYWNVVEDYRTGVRFAIPCFWVANIPQPEQDPSGLGSFSVNNFTEDFVRRLGNKQGQTVWMHGGVALYIGYHQRADFNLAPDASLEALAYALVNPDEEHGINSTHDVIIRGRQALQVETWDKFENGRFYLIPSDSELVVMVSPYPDKAAEHPDVQAILQSLAISPQEEVVIPAHKPADPPEGLGAECIGVPASEIPDVGGTDPTPLQGTLNCAAITEEDRLMWAACNIQDSLLSGNTQPLPGYMGDNFELIYWNSSLLALTPEQALEEITNNLLPPNTGAMTFTTDEALFPPRPGKAPPPGTIEEIYSEGWGQDGQGAALLYIAEDANGEYIFSGLMFSEKHFDK